MQLQLLVSSGCVNTIFSFQALRGTKQLIRTFAPIVGYSDRILDSSHALYRSLFPLLIQNRKFKIG